MSTDIEQTAKAIFGKEIVRAVELIVEQIPKLEKEVETCEVDSLRLIRSATSNNCIARVAEEINSQVFANNQERISKAVEKFADKCVCKKFSH